MSLRDFFGFADPPIAKMDVDAANAQYLNSYAAANAYLGAQPKPAPKPRLAAVRRAPSRDDFAAWRDNPVTQFVFAAMSAAQRAQQETWTEASWGTGNADQGALIELRARADAYAALEEATYEAFCEWAGVDPEGIKDA